MVFTAALSALSCIVLSVLITGSVIAIALPDWSRYGDEAPAQTPLLPLLRQDSASFQREEARRRVLWSLEGSKAQP